MTSDRLGVLVSGRGSNLAAILDAGLPVAIVISNRPGVPAVAVAERHGITTDVLRRSAFDGDADARDGAIAAALTRAGATIAVLAGYDQRLRASYFATFDGRTLNIHPSLLPRHGGPGMMGLAVHASVLASGDVTTGVTIHEVTDELDAGPILASASVPVEPHDTPETLADRVLGVEHRLLVDTLRALLGEA